MTSLPIRSSKRANLPTSLYLARGLDEEQGQIVLLPPASTGRSRERHLKDAPAPGQSTPPAEATPTPDTCSAKLTHRLLGSHFSMLKQKSKTPADENHSLQMSNCVAFLERPAGGHGGWTEAH